MIFIPINMKILLEDGRNVELDFSTPELLIKSDSPLTLEEKGILAFKAGAFIGGGNAALSQLNG